jgi:hypothetical protein
VLLRPAAPGTGVVAGGAVRILLEAAGLRDVLAKSLGASNPINNAWATINALKGLKRIEDVARLRGKTVEEIRRGSAAAASGNGAAAAVAAPATGTPDTGANATADDATPGDTAPVMQGVTSDGGA